MSASARELDGGGEPTKTDTSSSIATSEVGAMEGAMGGMRKLGLGMAEAFSRAAAAVTGGGSPGRVEGEPLGEGWDLHKYAQLQQRIAELQGLQIEAQEAHARRSEGSLQRRLAVVRQLQEDAQKALDKEQTQYEKLGAGKWYPGKVLLQNQDKKLAASHQALEQGLELVKQREAQVADLRTQLQRMQLRVEGWETKAGELAVAQAQVAVMEERMFGALLSPAASSATDVSLRTIDVVDCLCAMDQPDEEEEEEEVEVIGTAAEEQQPGQPAKKVDGFGCWGRGRLLRLVASTLGKPAEDDKDQYGRYFGGRLLRVTADKLERAVAGEALEVEVLGSEELELVVEGSSFKLEEAAEEAGGTLAAPPPQIGKAGEGGIMRAIADKLGEVDPAKHKDLYGGYGGGRLLRIAADKMQRAAAARRKDRQAAMDKVAGGIGAHGWQDPAMDDEELRELFPPHAAKFNPALHCPPSTFLWTYPNRFMGRLKKLRTGDVQHAYYRFGPFGSDPNAASGGAATAPDSPGRAGGRLPLLMLSGLGSTMVAWGVPLMRALSVEHEVIIMDYRGAGLSKVFADNDPWDYFKQAEAVLMLADALNIPRFNWVGWSSGGDVGLVLAALHSRRLGRMVSHAGVAGGKNTIAPPALRFLDPDANVSLGQTMALIFPPNDPVDFRRTCGQYIKEVFSMPKSIVDAEPSKKAAREQYAADQQFLAGEEQVWDALPQVAVPCLISNGTEDVLVPRENAERLAARIPGAQLHLFQGWGHGWKDSAKFARVLNDFLCAGDE